MCSKKCGPRRAGLWWAKSTEPLHYCRGSDGFVIRFESKIERDGEKLPSATAWVITAEQGRVLLGDIVVIGGPLTTDSERVPAHFNIDVTEGFDTGSKGKRLLGIFVIARETLRIGFPRGW